MFIVFASQIITYARIQIYELSLTIKTDALDEFCNFAKNSELLKIS